MAAEEMLIVNLVSLRLFKKMCARNVSPRNGLRKHRCLEKNSVWFKPAVWILFSHWNFDVSDVSGEGAGTQISWWATEGTGCSEKEVQGGSSCSLQLPERRVQPGGGQSGNEWQEERKQPPVVLERFRLKKFLHGMGGQALAQAAQGSCVESPSLQGFKNCGCGTWGHAFLVGLAVLGEQLN